VTFDESNSSQVEQVDSSVVGKEGSTMWGNQAIGY
jgi:hypothetical protein